MRQCKQCDNNQNYHLVPVIHPSNPDVVDHLCLDCLNKEIVKTGEITRSEDAMNEIYKFSRDIGTPATLVTSNGVTTFIHCGHCKKRLDLCQSVHRVSIIGKKPNIDAVPLDERGNAVSLLCGDCFDQNKSPLMAVYKNVEGGSPVVMVESSVLVDNY